MIEYKRNVTPYLLRYYFSYNSPLFHQPNPLPHFSMKRDPVGPIVSGLKNINLVFEAITSFYMNNYCPPSVSEIFAKNLKIMIVT